MTTDQATRDSIAARYFEHLAFAPYPVQEQALAHWFASPQGVLVCTPTGTGKTLIAEAALFEALQLGQQAYYTTPLIALTDQKFHELQAAAVRWGYSPRVVGLATGNRKLNPEAPIQVVVAEILFNRLLHREAFDFSNVWAVVMDEFHSFNDLERGVVWEFGLALLPSTVKTLLLSATVGNAAEFTRWLADRHDRHLALVENSDRRVPLTYHWIGDQLLDEQLESMFVGEEAQRLTPALVFCFNRETCWSVANLLRGKKLVGSEQQRQLSDALADFDWSTGAGPKLKRLLQRGIGIHHAGVLPRYRRVVEQLFQERLLSVCVCTETLAAGINLPARSVVLPSLVKGPPRKMKLIDAGSAQQMFGRAGRPQFDPRGHVMALAHEDDVKILRWQARLESIPPLTKDPQLLRARKALRKRMPRRREGFVYWHQAHFQQLVHGKPADLQSRGPLTWRLLAYMLDASSSVDRIRQLVQRRLLIGKAAEQAQRQLVRMLVVLHRAGYVHLFPAPPRPPLGHCVIPTDKAPGATTAGPTPLNATSPIDAALDLGQRHRANNPPGLLQAIVDQQQREKGLLRPTSALPGESSAQTSEAGAADYAPERAEPTDRLSLLLGFRGVHPLFGLFLINHLGIADTNERIQALESLLEISSSLGRSIDVPAHDELPPGPLALTRLDAQLLTLGLTTAEELNGPAPDENWRDWFARHPDWPPRPLPLAAKLQRLFHHDFPGVDDLRVRPCWVAGELLQFGADFNHYITCKKLQKQEGIIFRHLLRLVLLIDEIALVTPPEISSDEWREEMGNLAHALEQSCRRVDPLNTDQWLDESRAASQAK